MKLFHGSNVQIVKPELSAGKVNNDFGQGFYCTEDYELAAEWACQRNANGFVNSYELGMDDLSVLDLLDGNYSVLNWVAILFQNRTFDKSSDAANDICEYIIDNFLPDYKDSDLIIGYRADDSYFSYASAWLNNSISLQSLSRALRFGNLGEQIVLKSQRAFDNLTYVSSPVVDGEIYYFKFKARDTIARGKYQKLKNKQATADGIYAIDILRKEFGADDTRLRPYILKRR